MARKEYTVESKGTGKPDFSESPIPLPISLNIGDLVGNLPISLDIGDLVGNIPIDIRAQSLVGNIRVDINAQSMVGNVNVNIAASDITMTVTGSVSISTGSVEVSAGVVALGRTKDIDIGSEAIDRPDRGSVQDTTVINKNNPANANGVITSVKIWANTELTDCKVGIFYKTDTYTLKCRSAAALGTVVSGSEQTFNGLSLEVRAGDYIGIYASYAFGARWIERSTLGYAGCWMTTGDHCVVGDEDSYDFEEGPTISLYGSAVAEPIGVTPVYGGATYVNSNTATDDTARRFEADSKKLRDAIITVKDHDQFFGDSSNQTYRIFEDKGFRMSQIDISTLYFKNATLGQNGTVHILAVED